MARVERPCSSDIAAGSVATTTFQRQGRNIIAKTRTGPATQYSDKQITIRKVTKYAAQHWQTLSDAQRTAWGLYAVTHQPTDRDFGPHGWSGYSAFVRCNVGRGRYYYQGDPLTEDVYYDILPDPPHLAEPLPLDNLHFHQDAEGIHLDWTYSDPPPPGTPMVEAYASGLHSPGRNIPKSLCPFYSYAAYQDPPLLYMPEQNGRYTFYCRVIQLDTGQTSTWRKLVVDFTV